MTPLSFVHWVVCPSLYGLWWALSLLSIGLSVLLFVASDDLFLSFVHWVFCPSSLYGLWWALSLLSIGLSVLLLFMTCDNPFLFRPYCCLSFFSLWPLMSPFSFVHWVVCPSLYGLGWALSLLSIGLSVLLLLMTSDDPFLFCPLGCLSFPLWPLMTSLSFIHWVVCPSSIYGLWWTLSLLSDGLSVFLLFMASDEPILFYPLGCLSSIWPLVNPLSFVHWVVCLSLYDLWWPLSLLSIGLSVLLFMASDEPSLFGPLGCLSFFSLWPLMTPFSFVYWVVCPSSLYDLWWHLSLLSIGLSVLLLFMASDNLFCPSLYDLWWPLSLLSIGLSVILLFMTSDDPSLFCPLGFLSFSLWPLMTPFSLVHWVVCLSLYDLWWALSLWSIWVVSPSSLYGLWWPLSLLSIGLSVLLFMASDEPILFCPLGCLSFFSLWPLMTPLSFVHWVVCPSLYGLWWTLSLWSIGLSVLLFMASDDPFSFVHWVVYPSLYGLWWHLSLLSIGLSVLFMTSDDPSLFCPLGCLSFFSLWPLMTPLSFVRWVFCPSLCDLWWPLSLLSVGFSVLLFVTSDDPFLFGPLGCLSFSLWPLMSPLSLVHLGCLSFFSLWPLMTPFSFVHWVVCPSLYGLWWAHSLLSIGLSVLLLFMTSDDPSLFCPLGCLSFSVWPLMNPFSLVHWVVCPSLYGLWWPFLFCPLGCLSFSLWPLMTPLSFVHWVVCPLYDLWWPLSLLSIGLSVILLFMTSDDPSLFCPLGFLSFSLWPLMTPFSLVHWVVCPSLYDLWWALSLWSIWVVSPSSLYGLWWPLSLLSIGLSVLLFMASDEPILFCPLGCLSFFSLWPLMTPLSFVHWVVCPSLYGLWWTLSLWSIGLSVLLFMASDDPFSFVHWVVYPSLYGLWWHLSLLSIGLSVLFMASDDPFLFLSIGLSVLFLFMASDDPYPFCPLGCLSLSLWSLMNPFSFVHWVVCSSLYELWWPLSLLSIGLSVLLLFMTSDDPFLFCPLGFLSFFSLWPLMTPFSLVHWVVCPSLYDLWWPLSLWSIGLSLLLLFKASDDPFLFCPLGCLSLSLWPLMSPFSFVHWVFCPSSLYDLWWPLSLLSIGLSVLLFMTSDDPFSFVHWVVCPSSLYGLWWHLSLLSIGLSVLLFMASDDPFLSLVHWVVSPSSLYGLWWPLSLLSIGLSVPLFMASDEPIFFCPLGCLSFFSLWPLMTPLSFVHWVVCPSLYGLWWTLSLWSIGLSLLLFMASDDPFSFVHWVVCPSSLYGLWWHLSLLSIGLSVLLFMASDDPFLFLSIGLSVLLLFLASDDPSPFCPLGCLSLSLWPLMNPFSFVHWVVCSSSLYELWWPLSVLSIGLSVLLLYMISDDPFLFCPLCYLSFCSLWPLMTTFSFLHWVVCPSLYGLWWPLSRCYIGLSVLLFMASDDPFLFCPLGCLSFFSLWPLMTPLYFVHWVVCPSLYGLWWPFSLLSIGLSALLLAMASDDPSLFCPLGCLSFFSLWHLMTPFSFVHCVVCPSLYGLW